MPKNEVLFIYTLRYMWKIVGSDNINFKIVTDTLDGLDQFEKALLSVDGLERAAKEYISQVDCSRVGLVDTFFGGDK